jgi:hypothetical protein
MARVSAATALLLRPVVHRAVSTRITQIYLYTICALTFVLL